MCVFNALRVEAVTKPGRESVGQGDSAPLVDAMLLATIVLVHRAVRGLCTSAPAGARSQLREGAPVLGDTNAMLRHSWGAMSRFPVRTPEQLEEWIRAKIKRTRQGFTGFVVVHTLREEYICAATREDCERQALAMWGDDTQCQWRWFEVHATRPVVG